VTGKKKRPELERRTQGKMTEKKTGGELRREARRRCVAPKETWRREGAPKEEKRAANADRIFAPRDISDARGGRAEIVREVLKSHTKRRAWQRHAVG